MPPALSPSTLDQLPPNLQPHGYLLAGGQSSRMGIDKAFLPLAGSTLLDRAIHTLATVCCDVTLVGRTHPALRHIPDAAPHIGPVGGVTSALRDLRTRQATWALFLPVDVPLLPAALLQALVRLWLASPRTRIGFPIADGLPHPIVSLVHVAALPAFEQALHSGRHRLRAVLASAVPPDSLAQTHLTFPAGETLADGRPLPWRPTPTEHQLQPLWFSNCNTPPDLARLQQALAQARLS